MVTTNLKIISIKNVFTCNQTFINPQNAALGLKSQETIGIFSVLLCCAEANS